MRSCVVHNRSPQPANQTIFKDGRPAMQNSLKEKKGLNTKTEFKPRVVAVMLVVVWVVVLRACLYFV